jgi:hypothetical protein
MDGTCQAPFLADYTGALVAGSIESRVGVSANEAADAWAVQLLSTTISSRCRRKIVVNSPASALWDAQIHFRGSI